MRLKLKVNTSMSQEYHDAVVRQAQELYPELEIVAKYETAVGGIFHRIFFKETVYLLSDEENGRTRSVNNTH